jgi:tetratricopeptide (TPR) repeat protein
MQEKLSHFLLLTALCLLAVLAASACNRTPNENPNGNPTPSPGPATPSPEVSVSPDPSAPSDSEGTMILSTEGTVNLRPQGATGFAPILEKVWFMPGDELQVGQNSLAKVLCDSGICQLRMGNYNTCCTSECAVVVAMMRTKGGDKPVKRIELSPAEASILNESERKIRELNLGEVTTQFLITNLYSEWRLEETNQALDRLDAQLAHPAAQRELKELYKPMMRKTGDLHLKVNRVGEAEKLYLKDLNTVTPNNALNKRAVEKEKAASHAGLAEVETKRGNKTEAIRNLEKAKEIYVNQGDTKAVADTEKRIVKVRTSQQTIQPGRKESVVPLKKPQ